MEKFVSSWSDGKTLPESYVFPPGQRPAEHLYPKSKISVPLIDLGKADGPDRSDVVHQIMEAAQELGAFQRDVQNLTWISIKMPKFHVGGKVVDGVDLLRKKNKLWRLDVCPFAILYALWLAMIVKPILQSLQHQ